MLRARLALALILVAAPAAGVAQQAPAAPPAASAEASRLVAALMPDSILLLGMRFAIEDAVRTGVQPASVLECSNRLQRSMLTPYFEKIAAERMTVDEMRAATDFFGTTAGRKVIAAGLEPYAAAHAGREPRDPAYTPEETSALDTFGDSPAGQKLGAGKLFASPEMQQRLGPVVRDVLGPCVKAATKR